MADPISDLAAVPGPASVTLTWTPPEGCTDITLYFKKTANGIIAAVPGATITSAMRSYTVANLEPGIVYVFFLDVVGGDNQGRSNEVNATPLATDPTPTPTTVPGPSVTPGPTVTSAPTVAPSVTGAPSVSPGTGASGGGGCVAGNGSVTLFLLLLPLFFRFLRFL